MWLKNTKGAPDSMLTFAVGGFFTVVAAIAFSVITGTTFTIGAQEITISAPDATLVTAFLGATLLAYVNRRNTKDKAESDKEMLKMKIDAGIDDQ